MKSATHIHTIYAHTLTHKSKRNYKDSGIKA